MVDFREAYGRMAGLKSAGSFRIGISTSLSSEDVDVDGEGGRRRRETTGFYTTKLRSDIRSA